MHKFKAGDLVRINDVDGLTAEGVVRCCNSKSIFDTHISVKVKKILFATIECRKKYNLDRDDLYWGCRTEKVTPLNLSYKRIFIQRVTNNVKHR